MEPVPHHLIERALIGLTYPASRDEVLAHVRRCSQPQVLQTLEHLPPGTYTSAQEVSRAATKEMKWPGSDIR